MGDRINNHLTNLVSSQLSSLSHLLLVTIFLYNFSLDVYHSLPERDLVLPVSLDSFISILHILYSHQFYISTSTVRFDVLFCGGFNKFNVWMPLKFQLNIVISYSVNFELFQDHNFLSIFSLIILQFF